MPDVTHSMALTQTAHDVLKRIQEALSLTSFTALMRLTFQAMSELAGKVCDAPPGRYAEEFIVLRLTMPEEARARITEWGGDETANINVWTSLRRMLEQVARDDAARVYYVESIAMVMPNTSEYEFERRIRAALAATGISSYKVNCNRSPHDDPLVELTASEYDLLKGYMKRMGLTKVQAMAHWLGTSTARNEHRAWAAAQKEDAELVVIEDAPS
jgi:hypothetical protein